MNFLPIRELMTGRLLASLLFVTFASITFVSVIKEDGVERKMQNYQVDVWNWNSPFHFSVSLFPISHQRGPHCSADSNHLLLDSCGYPHDVTGEPGHAGSLSLFFFFEDVLFTWGRYTLQTTL
jgi:hypothetical protein